jgi:hypothetical protein
MAAEDYIDLFDYCDADYWDQNEDRSNPEDEGIRRMIYEHHYTNKFSFNGRRKRTKLQREITRERKLLGLKE